MRKNLLGTLLIAAALRETHRLNANDVAQVVVDLEQMQHPRGDSIALANMAAEEAKTAMAQRTAHTLRVSSYAGGWVKPVHAPILDPKPYGKNARRALRGGQHD